MVQTGQFVDGNWMAGEGAEFSSTCPIDESIIWQGNEARSEQIDAAFESARKACFSWWQRTSDQRIEVARNYARLVKDANEELALLIAQETGKPVWETRTEANSVVAKVELSIDAFRERRDTTSLVVGEMNAVTRFKPHGVCAVLGPFNFPAHLPNGHIVPALLAGNTVVFKPSEITPAVGAWMVAKWQQSGLPAGVLNLVQGGRDVGSAIAHHPQLDGLFFTGSSNVGRALHRAFADYPQKILALEMGGNNPLIVHEANDLNAAAYLTILSAYITSGQRCSCARRLILVDNPSSDEFLQTLIGMIKKVSVGFYNDQPQPFMGTVISQSMGQRLLAAQDALIQNGGEPLVEMKAQRQCDALVSPGLIDVSKVDNRSDEELFGPLLNVIRVRNFDEAIQEANHTAYGLSAGLLSDDAGCFEQFIHQIRAGVVNWNRQTTGASGRLPFGGCGLSGNHRPSGFYAADYCSFPVASLESSELKLPEQPMTGINL